MGKRLSSTRLRLGYNEIWDCNSINQNSRSFINLIFLQKFVTQAFMKHSILQDFREVRIARGNFRLHKKLSWLKKRSKFISKSIFLFFTDPSTHVLPFRYKHYVFSTNVGGRKALSLKNALFFFQDSHLPTVWSVHHILIRQVSGNFIYYFFEKNLGKIFMGRGYLFRIRLSGVNFLYFFTLFYRKLLKIFGKFRVQRRFLFLQLHDFFSNFIFFRVSGDILFKFFFYNIGLANKIFSDLFNFNFKFKNLRRGSVFLNKKFSGFLLAGSPTPKGSPLSLIFPINTGCVEHAKYGQIQVNQYPNIYVNYGQKQFSHIKYFLSLRRRLESLLLKRFFETRLTSLVGKPVYFSIKNFNLASGHFLYRWFFRDVKKHKEFFTQLKKTSGRFFIFNLFLAVVFFRSPTMLCEYLVRIFETSRNTLKELHQFNTLFKSFFLWWLESGSVRFKPHQSFLTVGSILGFFNFFNGFQVFNVTVCISGSWTRKKKEISQRWFVFGEPAFYSTIESKMGYFFKTAVTKRGIFGIHVWISYN